MAAETLQRTISSGSLTCEDGIAWLVLDDSAKRINTLSTRLFSWFEEQVDHIERERPDALVVLSGKRDGFVAGADIEELDRARLRWVVSRLEEYARRHGQRLEPATVLRDMAARGESFYRS